MYYSYLPALACFVAFSMLSIKHFTESLESCREMLAFLRAAISCCTLVNTDCCASVGVLAGLGVGCCFWLAVGRIFT